MGVNLLQHTPLLHDNAPTGTQQWVTYSCPLLPTQERLSIGRGRADPLRHRPPVAAMTSARCATNVSPSTLSPMARPRRQPGPPALRPVPRGEMSHNVPKCLNLEHVPLSPPPNSRPLGEWRRMTQNDSLEKKPALLRTPAQACVESAIRPNLRSKRPVPFRSIPVRSPVHSRSFPCAGFPGPQSAVCRPESQRRGRGNDGRARSRLSTPSSTPIMRAR